MISIETIYFLVSLNILFLIMGILLGFFLYGISPKSQVFESGFLKKKKDDKTTSKNTISIDEKKVVINVKTDDLEKKYNSLGTVVQTQENISSSVNKLKNLKG